MIRIGGATGYWGEADLALPQFLAEGDLDFIVFDYLAEITMSIMARAKAADLERLRHRFCQRHCRAPSAGHC